jgi:hypothetical protein
MTLSEIEIGDSSGHSLSRGDYASAESLGSILDATPIPIILLIFHELNMKSKLSFRLVCRTFCRIFEDSVPMVQLHRTIPRDGLKWFNWAKRIDLSWSKVEDDDLAYFRGLSFQSFYITRIIFLSRSKQSICLSHI